MRRTTSDQQSAFQSDYFLTQLSHFTEAKFSLFEHAPLSERRDRFRNHVEREEMPLTFCKMGINIPVKLEWSQTSGNEINFRSRPFLFNRIWVKVVGTMNSETLDGRVRFEPSPREPPRVFEQPPEFWFPAAQDEEPTGLTEAQIASLRRDGLPI